MKYKDLIHAYFHGRMSEDEMRGFTRRLRSEPQLRGEFQEAAKNEANLREANLREADLREVNLGGADLAGADLTGTDLRGADLGGADLRDTRWT